MVGREAQGASALPSSLTAEWVATQADFRAASRLIPGSQLRVVRMPVGLALLLVGFAFGYRAAPLFYIAAIAAPLWSVALFAARAAMFKRIASLPESERVSRISTNGVDVNISVMGHAATRPIAHVRRVLSTAEGVLLDMRGNSFFVPRRALAAQEEAWRAFVEKLPARKASLDLVITVVMWSAALAYVAYQSLHRTR